MPGPYDRPYGVWLPGLQRVMKLLNGTAGVRRVASSRVHRKGFEARGPTQLTDDDDDEEDEVKDGDDDGDAGGAGGGGVSGTKGRLVIRIDGTGNYGAHRLVASFENDRGLRTQQLFVSCERDFSLAQLRDVLRALQPVLNFILDEGGNMDTVPF